MISNEMIRSTNFWRRQRGLKIIDLKKIVAEALGEFDAGEGGRRGEAWARFKKMRQRNELAAKKAAETAKMGVEMGGKVLGELGEIE